MLKNSWLRIVAIVGIVASCGVLDQLTKYIAINNLVEFHSVFVIKDFFAWTLCYNTGGAWSIFSNSTWALVIVSLVALGLLVYSLFKTKNRLYTIAASIFMGGLIGNLIDRIFRGQVTDFLDFIIFGYDFPIFNVADIFIVCSAILIGVSFIIGDKKNEEASTSK